MKKSLFSIIVAIILIAIIGFAIYFFTQNSKQTPNNNPSPAPQKVSTETNITTPTPEEKAPVETELATFSTKILIDDDHRDNNLEVTASKIDGTIVKVGEEFSFNEVVGNPTPDKGYEKAGIFVDGKKVKGYGGGNCQVSTTLYDAVLKVKGLDVTERHEHGKEVGYVEMGKDATVAYDDLDLKFKNNTDNDIKIYTEITKEEVKVKLVKLTT